MVTQGDLDKCIQLIIGSNMVVKAFAKMFIKLENELRGKSFLDSGGRLVSPSAI